MRCATLPPLSRVRGNSRSSGAHDFPVCGTPILRCHPSEARDLLFVKCQGAINPALAAEGFFFALSHRLSKPPGASQLLHQLQVERDAYPIHQHLTFIDQLLVGDLGVGELPRLMLRAQVFQRFRALLAMARKWQSAHHREIVEVDSRVIRHLVQMSFIFGAKNRSKVCAARCRLTISPRRSAAYCAVSSAKPSPYHYKSRWVLGGLP